MTKLEETVNLMKEENTFRRYDDGDHKHKDFSKQIFKHPLKAADGLPTFESNF